MAHARSGVSSGFGLEAAAVEALVAGAEAAFAQHLGAGAAIEIPVPALIATAVKA